MAVLVEAISVVIRCESVVSKYAGGIDAFLRSLPNDSLCSDGELASLSFMVPSDVREYVVHLERSGLVFKQNEVAVDLVVVDQNKGMTSSCDWAAFGTAFWRDDPKCVIAVCSYHPTRVSQVVVPAGWEFTTSLTATSRFVDADSLPLGLRFVRSEAHLDVLYDDELDQEYFVRRS